MKKEIVNYVKSCVDTSARRDVIWSGNKYKALMDVFRTEKKEDIDWFGERRAFMNWCGGIPSCFHIDFATYRQVELLKSFGERVSAYPDKQLYGLAYDVLKQLEHEGEVI